MQLIAPWTAEQVVALNKWQSDGRVHEFKCKIGHTLIATKEGWVCQPGCDYTQDWCHDYMANGTVEEFKPWATAAPPEKMSDAEKMASLLREIQEWMLAAVPCEDGASDDERTALCNRIDEAARRLAPRVGDETLQEAAARAVEDNIPKGLGGLWANEDYQRVARAVLALSAPPAAETQLAT